MHRQSTHGATMNVQQVTDLSLNLPYWDRVHLLNAIAASVGLYYGACIDVSDVRDEIEIRINQGDWHGSIPTDEQIRNACIDTTADFLTPSQCQQMVFQAIELIEKDCSK